MIRAATCLRAPLLSPPCRCAHASTSAPKGKRPAADDQHAYSSSLRLPSTPFPLRANAAAREKLFRKRTTSELYAWQLEQHDRQWWVLHDGPPYANGNLHTGHALNKILKDIINRYRLLQGARVHYLPGWDTHGLPLELKALSAMKASRQSLSPVEIRAAARAEAAKGIDLQRSEFEHLGIMGEWGGYKTLDWAYERRQLRVFRDMVRNGLITTSFRPTLYSPSSRTALAEAELEYSDAHVSKSVYVALSLQEGSVALREAAGGSLDNIKLAVWTTTPWTLPANVAVAVSPTMMYTLASDPSSSARHIVATSRLSHLSETLGRDLTPIGEPFPGSVMTGTTYRHPTSGDERPVFLGGHVTEDAGTGLVHTAPAHGVEDWDAWKAFAASSERWNIVEIPDLVDDAGRFRDAAGERLRQLPVLGEGAQEVTSMIGELGSLLAVKEVTHKYPYDWRTKKPVIYRATKQWFANLAKLKTDALQALDNVAFTPATGESRLRAFISSRSEWCISRQRSWGVPIPVVYSSQTTASGAVEETPLLTPESIDFIVSVLDKRAAEGHTDYWWTGAAEEFVLPHVLEASKDKGVSWRKGTDTMDVWFDSGTSWTLFREVEGSGSEELVRRDPVADLYLEGSDQHRGWFQSSLLTKIAVAAAGSDAQENHAPYKAVMTHGMVLDEQGRKMSKSLGNILSPLTIINGGKNQRKQPAYGTDVLRLWVASVESTRDVNIGPNILTQIFESLRKIRNTARFMLGNLSGSPPAVREISKLPLTERHILNALFTLVSTSEANYERYAFSKVVQDLVAFTNTTLSAFYFDIVKDSLYADSVTSDQRQNVAFVLQTVLDAYLSLLAPIMPHLVEEIHHYRTGAVGDPSTDENGSQSFFQQRWVSADPRWKDEESFTSMQKLTAVREVVQGLLEKARANKNIGSSNEADVVLTGDTQEALLSRYAAELKDIFIVSEVRLAADKGTSAEPAWSYSQNVTTADGTTIQALIIPARLHKCPRCWTHRREEKAELCNRCADVVA